MLVLGKFLIWSEVEREHLGDERAGLLHLPGVGRDTDQSVCLRVELFLQRDHHNIHCLALRLYVGRNLQQEIE